MSFRTRCGARSGAKSIGVMFNGKTLGMTDEEGEPVVDDSFLIVVNASEQGVEYALPEPPNGTPWRQVLDTENVDDPFWSVRGRYKVIVGGRAIRVYSDGVSGCAEGAGEAEAGENVVRQIVDVQEAVL